MSDVDVIKKFDNKHIKNLCVAGVHGDGSCMIHSFLYLFNSKYREMSAEEKRVFGRTYRTGLSTDLLKNVIKSKSKSKKSIQIRKFFKNIEPTLETNDIQTYIEQVMMDPDVWLDEKFIIFLEVLMGINIVIFLNDDYYIRGNIYDRNKDIMLFNYIENTHYEPVFHKKGNTSTYIINNEDHEDLHDKILRSYLKTFRKSPVKDSPPPQEAAIFANEDPLIVTPHIEAPQRVANDDFDPTSSTSIDYYEKFIMEDDIIFEEIDDMSQIVLTRIDKSIPIMYSQEQTMNHVNDLFSFLKKGLKQTSNKNFTEMLSHVDEHVEISWTRMIPIVKANKKFYNDGELDMNEHLEERVLLMKDIYNKIHDKLHKHQEILYPTQENLSKEYSVSTVIRLCPELFSSLKNNISVDRADICKRFVYESNSISSLHLQKIGRLIQDQDKLLNEENFVEMYKCNLNDHKINGYFVANRYHKTSKNRFEVFNVSSYYKSIVSLKKEDLVYVSFHDGEVHEGVVIQNIKGVIKISMNSPVEFKNKTYTKLYFYTNPDDLHMNSFSLYGNDTPVFIKSKIFENDFMFIFDDEHEKVFFPLILPTLEEYVMMKNLSWNNIRECFDDLKQFFNIKLRDVGNTWIRPKRQKLSDPISNHKAVKVKPQFSNVSILQFEKSIYYPDLTSSIIKKNDTLLHRMMLLQKSFDHGLSKFNAYVLKQLELDEESTNKEMFVNEDEKLNYNDVNQLDFYPKVEDLIKIKKDIHENYKKRQLKDVIAHLDEIESYNMNIENIKKHLQDKQKNDKNYHLTDVKPQDIPNSSFLKSFQVSQGGEQHYHGFRDMVDFDEVFNNVEKTRVLNYENVGTMDDHIDETITISSKKSISQLINQISLEFGTFKLSDERISYICDNLVNFVAELFQERKALFMKKDPKKDVKKMFKSETEKTKYVEYTNIIVISCFILIFVSIDRSKIEFYNINKKCAEYFMIQGFPLNDNITTGNKSTLKYLSCVISKLYGNNQNMANSERNEKKIQQVTRKILGKKPELTIQLNDAHEKPKPNVKEKFVSQQFIRIKNPVTKTTLSQIDDDLEFPKIDFDKTTYVHRQSSIKLLQLKKTKERSDDVTPIGINFKSVNSYVPTLNERSTVSYDDDLNDLSKNVMELLDEIAFTMGEDFPKDEYYDRFVSFKNQSYDDTKLYSEALYRYLTNQAFGMISKIINKYNNDHHYRLITSNSVKYLKSHISDKQFMLKTASNDTKETTDMVMIQRIYENDDLYQRLVNIHKPVFHNQECNSQKDHMYLSLKNTSLFLTYCLELIRLSNVDILYITKACMKGLIHFTNHIDTDVVDYKEDVEKMREKDKQEKYNQKDRMGDDERLLYLMLEKVGYVPEMEEFSKIYQEEDTPVAYVYREQNDNNNPEYDPYLGENEDEI